MPAGFRCLLLTALFLPIETGSGFFHQVRKQTLHAGHGILEFLRIENHGAAFGILQGQMSFFYVISAVVGVVILYVLLQMPCEAKYFPLLVTVSFIAAGAVGNLIDRVFRKSVVDFIYFKPIDFPVFNVADIYVTTATAVMMFLILFYYKDEDFDFLKRSRRR